MPATFEKGKEHLVVEEWQLEKWRYCWWLKGLNVDRCAKAKLVNNKQDDIGGDMIEENQTE